MNCGILPEPQKKSNDLSNMIFLYKEVGEKKKKQRHTRNLRQNPETCSLIW